MNKQKTHFFEVWELYTDKKRFQALLEKSLKSSPYHTLGYLLAEEKAEDYCIKIAELWDEEENFAFIPVVIRKINDLPYMANLDGEYYDLITPHEYSAIMSNTTEDFEIELLLKLTEYCRNHKIVFQFYRINPYFYGQQNVYEKAGFQVVHSGEQVYVDLEETKEQIWKNYKGDIRTNIRRAEKEGLAFEIVDVGEESIDIFMKMYQKAMDTLQARKFLYFNYAYFKALLETDCAKLAFVKDRKQRVIGSGVLLTDSVSRIAYYHLGCFDRAYTLLRPMNFLIHSIIIWCQEKKMKYFHIGGGGESLLRFKNGYSKNRIDYYIAYDKSLENEYNYITQYWKNKFPQYTENDFKPAYRWNE